MKRTALFILLWMFPASAFASLGLPESGPDAFSFPARSPKVLRVESDRDGAVSVRIFRVGKALDAVRDFGLDTGPTLLPVFDPVFRERYRCEEEFYFEEPFVKGENDVFLPVARTGLYAIALRRGEDRILLLFNVTEIGLFVKKDRTKAAAYVQFRETGRAVPKAELVFTLPDKKHKTPVTDDDGLCLLEESDVMYAERIIAVLSNSMDIETTPAWVPTEEPAVRLLSVPDTVPVERDGDLFVTTFLFRKDAFREYEATDSFRYTLVWAGRTNTFEATGGFGRVEMPSAGGATAGLDTLETRAEGAVHRTRIPVVAGRGAKVYAQFRVTDAALRGRTVPVTVCLKNFGHKKIAVSGLEWTARKDRTVLSGKNRLPPWFGLGRTYRFKVPTGRFESGDGPVLVTVILRLPDGTRINAEKTFQIYDDVVSSEPALEHRIFLPGEPVSVALTLRNRKSPFKSFRSVCEIKDAARRQPVFRAVLSRRAGVTNVVFYPRNEGEYEIRVTSGKKNRTTRIERFWVVPEKGDLPLPADGRLFDIVTDRDEYEYGDIARVLLMSRRKNAEAFFTFEGDALFQTRKVRFEQNYVLLDLPVTEANRPNGFLVLQTILSNRFESASKRIGVPARHKAVYYGFGIEPELFGRSLLLSTRNVWARPIRVFSFARIGADWASFWEPFEGFYGDIENRVAFCGRKSPGAGLIAPEHEAVRAVPTARDAWPGTEESEVFFFPDTSGSNTIRLRDELFPHQRSLELVCRSVSRDAKTGFIRMRFELNNLVSFRFLVPASWSGSDKPSAALGMKNLTRFERPVRIVLTFTRDDVILFRTNRAVLKPEEERAVTIPFPAELLRPGRTKVTVECRTPESVLKKEFLTEAQETGDASSFQGRPRKSVRRIRPGIPGRYGCEEAAEVRLRVRRDAFVADEGIRDEVPAGFRPIQWSVEEAGGRTDGRFVWFPPGQDRVRYLIRASVPGEYEIPPAVVTAPDDVVPVRFSRHPRRLKIVL